MLSRSCYDALWYQINMIRAYALPASHQTALQHPWRSIGERHAVGRQLFKSRAVVAVRCQALMAII